MKILLQLFHPYVADVLPCLKFLPLTLCFLAKTSFLRTSIFFNVFASSPLSFLFGSLTCRLSLDLFSTFFFFPFCRKLPLVQFFFAVTFSSFSFLSYFCFGEISYFPFSVGPFYSRIFRFSTSGNQVFSLSLPFFLPFFPINLLSCVGPSISKVSRLPSNIFPLSTGSRPCTFCFLSISRSSS